MPEENKDITPEDLPPKPGPEPQPGQPQFRREVPHQQLTKEYFRGQEVNPEPPVPAQPIASDAVVEGLQRPDENPSDFIAEHALRQAAAQPGPIKGDEPEGSPVAQPTPSRTEEPGNQIGLQGTVP
jgi:hypothetical protein